MTKDLKNKNSDKLIRLRIAPLSPYGTNTERGEEVLYTTVDRQEQSNMPPQQEGGDAWQKEQDSRGSKQSSPHLSITQLDPYQSAPRLSVLRRESFIMDFATSKGPPQIVFLCMLLAMGFGATIGVVRTFVRYSV
jgi:hypothetical protein